MILDKSEVRSLYNRMAGYYDLALWGYRLSGIDAQRARLVLDLKLSAGDTVVDLGCGTGANLRNLSHAVGPAGRVVGVDLSEAMLEKAEANASRAELENVELRRADVGGYRVPQDAAAVISTFALEMIPEYDAVIGGIAGALAPGRRLGLLGLKRPEGWPDWLVSLGVRLNKPFGVSRDYESFRPWESVRERMELVGFEELLFGAAYRCVAAARD